MGANSVARKDYAKVGAKVFRWEFLSAAMMVQALLAVELVERKDSFEADQMAESSVAMDESKVVVLVT